MTNLNDSFDHQVSEIWTRRFQVRGEQTYFANRAVEYKSEGKSKMF